MLAARICHRCPYDTLLVTAPPAPTTPCYFSYLLLTIYALWHAESLDLLAAEAGLDIRLDIPQAHDLEAAEVFIQPRDKKKHIGIATQHSIRKFLL